MFLKEEELDLFRLFSAVLVFVFKAEL